MEMITSTPQTTTMNFPNEDDEMPHNGKVDDDEKGQLDGRKKEE